LRGRIRTIFLDALTYSEENDIERMFTPNFAYRYLAIILMLHQANWFCEKLELPWNHEYTESDVREGSHTESPSTNDFGGSILTDEYFFGFDGGHIANFYKQGFRQQTDEGVKRQNVELSKLHSQIDTNKAWQLATNWLCKSGVDVSKIATNYTVKVDQWEYFPKYQPTGGFGPISKDAVKLPIYSVQWSGSFLRKGRFRHTGPVIQITVSGVTKELLEYHVYTDQVFTNSSIQITDLDKVLGISDDQFQNYNESQRSNLVFQCARSPANP